MNKDISLSLMAGIEIPIPSLQLIAHSPTIKDIAYMGESKFFQSIQYLCIDKTAFDQGETVLSNINNFQILMKVLEEPEKKKAILTLLSIIFPNYRIMITPKSINLVIKDQDQVIMIDNDNFEEFQSMMKEILCVNSIFQGKNIIYKPKGEKAKTLAEKMMKNRQRIAKQKANQEGDSSILTRYLSILRIGPRIPLTESIEYNLFQLFDQIERYNAYVEWDVDLQLKLAGGIPSNQVETWMRNLYSMK